MNIEHCFRAPVVALALLLLIPIGLPGFADAQNLDAQDLADAQSGASNADHTSAVRLGSDPSGPQRWQSPGTQHGTEPSPSPISSADEAARKTLERAQAVHPLTSWEVPGKVVVRFADELEACVATAFRHGSAEAGAPLAAVVDELRALGVKGITPVHRTPREQADLLAARSEHDGPISLPLSDLLEHHGQRLARVATKRGITAEKLASLPALHHVYTLDLGDGSGPQLAIEKLETLPGVRWATTLKVHTTHLSNDPFVDPDGDDRWQSGSWGQDHADQWALEALGWGDAWERRGSLWTDPERVGGGGITIAVIDSGVDYEHPDLAARTWRDGEGHPGRDFVDIDTTVYTDAGYRLVDGEDYTGVDDDPRDRQGHGTHVAGIAAASADDGVGMAGVAWNATLMPVRAGFALGITEELTTGALESDDVAAAIAWAADSGADILNMSFGGRQDPAIADAIQHAYLLGVLMVASAGNADIDVAGNHPADNPRVIAVGATRPDGKKAAFSNWGEDLDLVAPGQDILSTRAAGTLLTDAEHLVGERHIRASGTSMAAPQVAGVAALVASAHPELSALDLWLRVFGTARAHPELLPGRQAKLPFGLGLPDLSRALDAPYQPHIALRSVGIAPIGPTGLAQLGGNTTIAAGALTRLELEMVNVWQTVLSPKVELVSDDPYLFLEQVPLQLAGWLERSTEGFEALLTVDPSTPANHRPDLRIRITADGFEQELELPLVVNGPRNVVLVPEDLSHEFNYGFTSTGSIDGRFLAAWTRFDRDHERYEARLGLFDEEGRAIGESRLLHDPDDGYFHSDAVLDQRSDGSFVVAWRRGQYVDDTYQAEILVQRFDAQANAIGEPIALTDPEASITQDLSVAASDEGPIAVGWWGIIQSTYSTSRLQMLSSDGTPIGGVSSVTLLAGHHSGPALAFGPDGNLLFTWRAHLGLTDDGKHDINVFGRVYSADGTPLTTELEITQEKSQFETNPAIDADGSGWAVAWEWCDSPISFGGTDLCSIRARRLGAGGQFLGDERVIEPPLEYRADDVRVVSMGDGGFVTAYEACLQTGIFLTSCEIRAHRLDAAGRLLADVHRIDSMNALHDPSLSVVGDRLLLSWNNSGFGPFATWGQLFRFEEGDLTLPCVEDGDSLCLGGGRFEVTVEWQDFDGGSGKGQAQPLGGTSGYFSFFDPDNVEILVKVLDGRPINGHWWVYYASLSNVEYRMTVRDSETGTVKIYENPPGNFASDGDTDAFPGAIVTGGLEAGGVAGSAGREKSAQLELHGGRFRIEVSWTDFEGGVGSGEAIPLTDDSGAFWFFDDANIELVVKILDGRPINGQWWVYYGSMSNVAYTLRITDTETGTTREYQNPLGNFASRGDVQAF